MRYEGRGSVPLLLPLEEAAGNGVDLKLIFHAALPQLAFIIDPNREEIAVKECRKLGIPIVAVTDTNCDPDVIDYIIPGNDDAIRAIKLFVTAMAEACLEGEAMRKDSKNKDAEEELKKAADAEAKAEEAPAVEAAAE